MPIYKCDYERDSKSKYAPVFKTPDQYATKKIEMLRHDFCINVTEEDEVYIRKFKSEHEINSACKAILNKYWS